MPDRADDDDDATVVGISTTDVGELSKDRAYLIVIAGTQVGEMIPVSGASVLGRGVEADVRLLEAKMSRRHCRVVVDEAETYIEDLGSANGTYVNGVRIARQTLNDGDKIQVGETTILKFTYHDRLEETFQKQMYDSALRDGLTRIYNKRYFQDRLRTEVAFTSRHRTKLSLILFDIDHFKQVNDTHGHLAGDKILSGLAAHVERLLRAEDVFARWGGEEFAVLCRETDLARAEVIAERIRASVEKLRFVFNGQALHVTISLGVAMLPDPRIADEDGFMAATDTVLYEAKRGGRNRVVCRPVA